MTKKKSLVPATGEFLLYTTADGRIRIETRMQGETVWLNQKQLAELFQTSVPNINMHIKNIFDEGELSPEATIQDFLTVRREGSREVQRNLTCYNLDMIISVGYRIKSHAGSTSHDEALRKAHAEYERFRNDILSQPTRAELDFLEAAKILEKSGDRP
ncbi:MAG: RhuM family protein [Geobacteraceae bacterium]